MYNVIRDIISYNGQVNIDNSIIQVCQVLIPVLTVFFIWCFTKLIAYVVNFGKK